MLTFLLGLCLRSQGCAVDISSSRIQFQFGHFLQHNSLRSSECFLCLYCFLMLGCLSVSVVLRYVLFPQKGGYAIDLLFDSVKIGINTAQDLRLDY